MSGRKCEKCFDTKLGYCPFDYACKNEVWERFNKVKQVAVITAYPDFLKMLETKEKEEREVLAVSLSSISAVCTGEVQSNEKCFQ